MTKFNTLIKFKDGSHMFERDHKAAFENAISKGLNNPESWMYMYSQNNKDFFKNISMRNYINFEFEVNEPKKKVYLDQAHTDLFGI